MPGSTLDRIGISIALASMLRDDTSILYGASRLLQIIEGDPKQFDQARIDSKTNRHGLYLWARSEGEPNVRSQNADYTYAIGARFEAVDVDLTAAYRHLDDAYERAKDLVNDQMYTGSYLTGFYTDANATVIDLRPSDSDFPEPEREEGNKVVIEIESAFIIEINRTK